MIAYDRFTLTNGLRILVHRDTSTPIVAINILYNVGSRDEQPDRTGFAHLFEHLMFGGSKNIPKYDAPLERVGGENNAFTNNDITNYYLTVPVQNLETAFWLESDRMADLAFSPKSLKVQRNVVVEEFKQNYLNQPYGDAWLLLRPLAYKIHPYQWATIGKDIAHIEQAKMDEVKDFYHRFYNPNNAILTIAGDVDLENIHLLCKKWFGPITKDYPLSRSIPAEPPQTSPRKLEVKRDVPYDAIYKVYHMCDRRNPAYYASDLISDILSGGKSARFYNELIKKRQLFSDINAYITGDIDGGLFVVTGKLIKGVEMAVAEEAINIELRKICLQEVEEKELQKVKNRVESSLIFSELSVLDKAMNLAYYEWLGEPSLINTTIDRYLSVSAGEIKTEANKILCEENCSTLYYYSTQKA
ncbi:MAG: M16 family metallopeptidase [Bacteroidales bacterium]